MQGKKIISEKIRIVPKTEIVYFLIRLPSNAEAIIGVEHGIRLLGAESLPGFPEQFTDTFSGLSAESWGRLRLEHPGCYGVFYASSVTSLDMGCAYADFSATPDFAPADFSHGFSKRVDEVNIPRQSRMIRGIFQNSRTDETYDLLVHLWVQTKKEAA